MVDVLQNYMQEAISVVRLPRRARDLDQNHEENERPTAFGLHRSTTEKQRIRIQVKEQEKVHADHLLYQIKESSLPSLPLPSKTVSNLSCRYCKPTKTVSESPLASSFHSLTWRVHRDWACRIIARIELKVNWCCYHRTINSLYTMYIHNIL